MTGWFDFTMKGTMNFYERVRKFKHSKQKLVIGPWTHGQNYFPDSTKVGEEDLGVEARYGLTKLRLAAVNWFDQHLKASEIFKQTTELFVLFDNKWATVPSDLSISKMQRLYFSSEKGANSKNGDGSLGYKISSGQAVDTFTYDPLNPVPTNGGANFHFFPNYLGIRDQAKLQNRKDVLVYTSERMTNNTTIIGTSSIDMWISTSAPSTDFSFKLFLLDDSTGSRKLLSDGIKRLDKSSKNFKPGIVNRIRLDFAHTAFTARRGQRIGVEISSSNFPKFERNLNTGEAMVTATRIETARQTIYHNKKYPSSLSLPVYNRDK
jgi:putative CocE/NonD family hydrolase